MLRKTELLDALRRDRVFLEVDAPYTGKASQPGDLLPAGTGLAEAWQVSITAAEDTILSNQVELAAALQVRVSI